jgi:enamine deaminase RidA (YjgF/YER057c/UK114 family)
MRAFLFYAARALDWAFSPGYIPLHITSPIRIINTPPAHEQRGHYSQAIVHGNSVYVSDIAPWGTVNSICAQIFGNHRPARTIVPVKDLHCGSLIEIDANATL